MPRTVRLLLVASVVLAAVAAGFYATSALAPGRLHREVESWLERVTRAEAKITTLRLVFGFPLHIEGTGLRLYDGALTVERASARIDLVSLLLGKPRLMRLRLDGAHLEVERSPEGIWDPPIFKESDRDAEEPALASLRAIEGATRFLLTKPLLADTLVVRRSRVSLLHPPPSGYGPPVRVVFESVAGRLLHSRLFGDARLFLRVRLVQAGDERGRLEWNGSRDEGGAMQVTMAATGLDLSTLATYLRGTRPEATLSGTLDGVADFTTAEQGVGRLDLDLGLRNVETSVADARGPASEPLRLPSLSVRMQVDLDHERVVLSRARIGTGDLDFALDARIDRPLRDASSADFNVTLSELAMNPETAQKLARWLPAASRERFESLALRVRSGRLVQAELRGAAPLRRWRELFAGRLDHLPAGLRVQLEIEDVAIDAAGANRLEHLTAQMAFESDTLEVHRAVGDLNGGPLPELQVTFAGLSKLLDAPPDEREMVSTAEALVGLTPLFEFLSGDPDEQESSASDPPSVAVTFEHVDHPALLWPLHDLRVQLNIAPAADGIRMELERCAWAGVALDGVVDWTLRPDRRVAIDLVASDASPPPTSVAAPLVAFSPDPRDGEPEEQPWMEGHFEVGAVDSPGWSQRMARGRFAAAGGALRVQDVEIQLTPSGLLAGELDLDLTRTDSVPYGAELALERGDIETLIAQRGAQGQFATGNLGVRADLRGNLVPGRPLLHDASGTASLRATEGAIQRSVPPVLALALASSSFNPFSRRDELHYRRGNAEFVFENGEMRTDALEIDGPDIRLFASGTLTLSEPPHSVDAEVVLFLFRQVDRALEFIPILNVLLLGENQNLVAAYFQLVGTWEEPVAQAKPFRTLEEGPGDVLTKGIPLLMKRGIDAIGGLFRGSESNASPPAEAATPAAEGPTT